MVQSTLLRYSVFDIPLKRCGQSLAFLGTIDMVPVTFFTKTGLLFYDSPISGTNCRNFIVVQALHVTGIVVWVGATLAVARDTRSAAFHGWPVQSGHDGRS
jgi:hypothetical protein